MTLNVDIALLLRLCSDVATLSCDVATLTWSSAVMCDVVVDVTTLTFSALPTLVDVATLEIRYCVKVMILSTRCRDIELMLQ